MLLSKDSSDSMLVTSELILFQASTIFGRKLFWYVVVLALITMSLLLFHTVTKFTFQQTEEKC